VTSPPYNRAVFLNVPFDIRYRKLFRALVFGIHDCGLSARCAMESDDGSQVRLDKLYRIIEQCRFGVHDLSRTTLDGANRLPRFNMPFELGLFLGAKRFGGRTHRSKCVLILDSERYRYQIFCSDIAGQDIRAHGNQVATALRSVRNWLQAALPRNPDLPGPDALVQRYLTFRMQLPLMCRQQQLTPSDLTLIDYQRQVEGWLEVNPRS
jgi:hypothetical protein